MRLVVRSSSIRPWSASVRAMAGWVTVGVRFWPLLARRLIAVLRAWRVSLGLAIGVPVTAGWPLLFSLVRTQSGYQHWMQGIAIPWWIMFGTTGLVLLAAKACSAGPPIKDR